MEYLVKCYQQRLNNLTQTFLHLLNCLQDSKLFISKPQLSQTRLQYIGHVISSTLKNQQQNIISKLNHKVYKLQEQLKMLQYQNICQESVGKFKQSQNTTYNWSPQHSSNDITIIRPKSKKIKNNICDLSLLQQSGSCSSLQNTINSYSFKYLKLKI